MNPDSGHLVSPERLRQLREAGAAEGYEPVPSELTEEARRKLAGAMEARVSKHDGRSRLGKWAVKTRKARRLTEKRKRYLERKRKVREGNRQAGKVSV